MVSDLQGLYSVTTGSEKYFPQPRQETFENIEEKGTKLPGRQHGDAGVPGDSGGGRQEVH